MTRASTVLLATVLGVAGLAGVVVFLTGQGLDRAEKWVSLVGVFISLAVAIAGLILAWRTTSAVPAGRVRRTGNATAVGPGSRAVTGSVGGAQGGVVERTGDARAERGAQAVTGEDRTAG
jgi:hypothetical protein